MFLEMTFTKCHYQLFKENNTMEQQKLELYLMTNREYFPEDKIVFIREKLQNADDQKFMMISALQLKNPVTMLLFSLFLGAMGVDRFMLGDTAMGVLKLLTCGLCGILTIIDWFTISKKPEKPISTKSCSCYDAGKQKRKKAHPFVGCAFLHLLDRLSLMEFYLSRTVFSAFSMSLLRQYARHPVIILRKFQSVLLL